MGNFYDLSAKDIDGKALPLSKYKGKVTLAVNVASKCGLTPQYTGLEQLYQRFAGQGLVVLGFPCNQFAGQEPGSESEIKDFCSTKYNVTFPLTSKIDVNGKSRHPVYGYLAGDGAKYQGDILWNFEKFLIGRDGEVVARFNPRVTPDSAELVGAVERALG
jgi:glutathione peroxidase